MCLHHIIWIHKHTRAYSKMGNKVCIEPVTWDELLPHRKVWLRRSRCLDGNKFIYICDKQTTDEKRSTTSKRNVNNLHTCEIAADIYYTNEIIWILNNFLKKHQDKQIYELTMFNGHVVVSLYISMDTPPTLLSIWLFGLRICFDLNFSNLTMNPCGSGALNVRLHGPNCIRFGSKLTCKEPLKFIAICIWALKNST